LAPEGFGYWRFDESLSVGAQQGITPHSGERMLQFVGSSRDVTQFGSASASEQIQLVDVSALAERIDAGEVRATASAWFARVVGCLDTDDAFGVYLIAFDGEPATFAARWTNGVNAAVAQGVSRDLADMTGVDGWLRHRASSFRHNDPADRISAASTPDEYDGDVFAWRRGEVIMEVPPQTRFLAVIMIALENVRNDTEFPELHGHYADDATLVLSGTLTFEDSEFNPGDWTKYGPVFEIENPPENLDEGTFEFSQVADVDPRGRVVVTNVRVDTGFTYTWGFIFKEAATYDPAEHGSVARIDVTWDARRTPGTSRNPATTFAIRQDAYYWMLFIGRQFITADGEWRRFELRDLVEASFDNEGRGWRQDGQPPLPDFSHPMTFGYAQGASCAIVDGTTQCPAGPGLASADIDNWRVVLTLAEG
jgi:hypothetical protein